ncbi:hypothetical protein XENOCAPTIV_010960 [Xenoophorus captivus]|uniref:Uncharacterized protein n=1 Tax=Xenoophorus captivus TaxID=1517983 RepID=A0ABV0SEK6_9TELE
MKAAHLRKQTIDSPQDIPVMSSRRNTERPGRSASTSNQQRRTQKGESHRDGVPCSQAAETKEQGFLLFSGAPQQPVHKLA